jgi:hypothetical protein
MESKNEMWPAEDRPKYESPRVEIFEVMVEKGFGESLSPSLSSLTEGDDLDASDY